MQASRRQFLVGGAMGAAGLGAAGGLTACAPTVGPPGPTFPPPACAPPSVGGPAPLPTPGTAGLIDEAMFSARVDEFLALATTSLDPRSDLSVLAHLIRARRDPSFAWDPSAVSTAVVDADPYEDTVDFRLMNYQWLLRLGRGVLPVAVIAAIEDAIAGFRYRYDDPIPAGAIDHKWFWSENHRIIFAVDEYLGGLALPDRVFTFTGLTGAQHAERSRQRIVDWILERSRFGYSEWHSNTYMKYSYAPLLTLVEFAPDPELVTLAASAFDVCMFDLACHTLGGAYGVTHGRAYKSAKTNSLGDSSFGTAKLLFDTTSDDYQGTGDIGPLFLAGSERYRLPEVIRRVARSQEVAEVRERHGVPLDPHAEFTLRPDAPYGYDFDDPANLSFWWSHGALTAWQLIPVTLDAARKYDLFETELFSGFKAVQQFADVPPIVGQAVVRELASFAAAGVLGEAHTYTWRSPEVMLSSVLDHRFGDAMEQAHAWQATLGPEAVVFTTHPKKDAKKTLDWGDDRSPMYWTGTASMPRSAQLGRASIHVYRPSYVSPTDPILGPIFGYQPLTHAFFPQDRFDEVVEVGHWVCGRKGDGYVALWSERPTQWRDYDPAVYATGGHTLPFDLVAPGSAQNVWICEVGRVADHGSFAAFVAAVTGAAVEVRRTRAEAEVTYASPTEGTLGFGTIAPFTVDGVERALRDHPRHSSPWAEECAIGLGFDIRDGGARLAVNFDTAGRSVEG